MTINSEYIVKDIINSIQKPENYQKTSTFFLLGPYGIGKTYLLNKIQSHFINKTDQLITFKGIEEYGDGFNPIIEGIINYYMQNKPVFRKRTLKAIGLEAIRDFLEKTIKIPSLEPILKNLLEFDNTKIMLGKTYDYLKNQKIIIYLSLIELLKKIKGKNKLILAFEDVQWFDGEALGFIAFLANSNINGIYTICTFRTHFITNSREEFSNEFINNLRSKNNEKIKWFDLQSFSLYETHFFIKSMLGQAVSFKDKQINFIYNNCKGNPYFLKMILLYYLENGIIYKSEKGYEFEKIAIKNIIPKSIENIIKKRLIKIYSDIPPARNTLEIAATIGERFQVYPINKLLNEKDFNVINRLKEIESKYSLIHEIVEQSEFEFDHKKIQEVIYSNLGIRVKKIHEEIANILEYEFPNQYPSIAYHYLKAEIFDKGLEFLNKAINYYLLNGLFESAASACIQYLNLFKLKVIPREVNKENELKIKICDLYYKLEKYKLIIPFSKEVISSPEISYNLLISAKRILGMTYLKMGTREFHELGVSILEEGIADAKKVSFIGDIGKIYLALAPAYDKIEKYNESQTAFNCGIKLLREAKLKTKNKDEKKDYEIFLAEALRKSCMFYSSEISINLMMAALKTFELYNIGIEKGKTMNNIGTEYFYLGDFVNSKKYLQLSLYEFKLVGGIYIDYPLNNLGLIHLVREEYDKSIICFTKALEFCSDKSMNIFININLATAYRKTGKCEIALDILLPMENEILTFNEIYHSNYYYFNLAMIYFDLQNYSQCIKLIEKVKPHEFRDDSELILGKRKKFLAFSYKQLKNNQQYSQLEKEWKENFNTNKKQLWYYNIDFYPCEVEFWSS